MERSREAEALARFEELVELSHGKRAAALADVADVDPALAAALAELLAADAAAGDRFLGEDLGAFAPELVDEALAAGEIGSRAGERIGAWRLGELLGRGGQGEVWAAERADGAFEQAAALKLLRRESDSRRLIARFERERQILARLDHPGIARLLDGGVAPDGRPYFVLERVSGEPIRQWCERRSAPIGLRVRVVAAVARAVAAAHRRLVVHRDLKPSNILVGGDGEIKLLDFGIAKLLSAEGEAEAEPTRIEERALTPAYAAPEQIRGEGVGTAVDIYALGVILYELLTGRLPHRRSTDSAAALVAGLELESVVRPSRVLEERGGGREVRALAGDLDTIVLKALAREPERRYGSADALADDLDRFLDGRPVLARPDSALYRGRKFVARHRVAMSAAAIAAIALVVGAVTASVQARRATRASDLARAEAERARRVSQFLVSVFDAADPARTLGERIDPRVLVDEGVVRSEVELAADPVLRAEMHQIFAGLYRKLGELDRAQELAGRALVERAARYGSDSVEAATSEWTLGWILAARGEFAQAQERLERAIATLDRVEGPESLAAADAREPLVEVLYGSQGPAAALPVVERRLATYRAALGERHEKSARCLSDLGVVLNDLGRVEEAERAYRSSLATLDSLLAPRDPRRAYPHNNLAMLLRESGRLDEAESEAREALAIRQGSLGDRHPETAHSRGQLARVLLDLGRVDEAETAAREMLSAMEGRDRFGALMARSILGAVVARGSQPNEAIAILDRALSEHLEILGEEHLLTYSVQLERLRALAASGSASLARAELAPLLVRLEGKGPEHASALSAARALAARLAPGRGASSQEPPTTADQLP